MTALDEIRAQNDRANNLIILLDTLLTTDRPQLAQRIVYIGAKFYLQQLVIQLEQIEWELALAEIQQIIGNTVFTGENTSSIPYSLELMLEIRDELITDCPLGELECLVEVAANHSEINHAVKQRIINDVNEITPYTYTGYGKNNQPLSVNIPDPTNSTIIITVPFTDERVIAQQLYEQVPFEYDREATSNLAINLSKRNFKPYANGGFPQNVVDVASVIGVIVRNAVRSYSDSLTHVFGSTGSSIFISECLYAGLLPMTVRPEVIDPADPDCEGDDINGVVGGFTTNSWRVCPEQDTASQAWKSHPALFAYFTDAITGLSGVQLGDVFVQAPNDADVTNGFKLSNLIYTQSGALQGQLREGELGYDDARTKLITIFNTPPLSYLQAGDYIFYPGSSGDNHGFMVVGWGPILGVQDSIDYVSPLDTQQSPHTLSTRRGELDNSHIVPYVADFCFGTDETNDGTGWLQDPRPRAFYATVVRIEDPANLRTDQIDLLKKVNGVAQYNQFELTASSLWRFYRIARGIVSDPIVDITLHLHFRRLYRQIQVIQT